MSPRPMRAGSEQAFQVQVQNLATFYGWRYYHAPDNRPVRARSGRTYVQDVRAGFPDLVLVRAPRLIFAELKIDTGRTSPEQDEWIRDLAAVGDAVAEAVSIAQATAGAYLDRGRDDGTGPSIEAYVWRPAQLQEITTLLASEAAANASPREHAVEQEE